MHLGGLYWIYQTSKPDPVIPVATIAQVTSRPTETQNPSLTPTIQQKDSGINGSVLNGNTGKAVAEVTIVFESLDGSLRKEITSDAKGQYQIDLPQGNYNVTASHKEYQPYVGAGTLEISNPGYQSGSIILVPLSIPTQTALVPKKSGSANCDGFEVDGICFYFGDENISCDAVCSTHSGTTDAIVAFMGSSRPGKNCSLLLTRMDIPILYEMGDDSPDALFKAIEKIMVDWVVMRFWIKPQTHTRYIGIRIP